jgi:hypothetical protein
MGFDGQALLLKNDLFGALNVSGLKQRVMTIAS